MPYVIVLVLILVVMGSSGDDVAKESNESARFNSASTFYSSDYSDSDSYYDDELSEDNTIDRDTAIEEHWDEIRDYANGSETVEACSSSGCYDLDADISSGEIEQIHFPNGGYRYLNEDIDENGDASGYDYDQGTNWDVSVDMDSGTIDDAVQDWADDNGYTLE